VLSWLLDEQILTNIACFHERRESTLSADSRRRSIELCQWLGTKLERRSAIGPKSNGGIKAQLIAYGWRAQIAANQRAVDYEK
jgi:hypothetical protein